MFPIIIFKNKKMDFHETNEAKFRRLHTLLVQVGVDENDVDKYISSSMQNMEKAAQTSATAHDSERREVLGRMSVLKCEKQGLARRKEN